LYNRMRESVYARSQFGMDIIFVVLIVGFFLISWGLVKGLERL
jgi:hypothetical protein